MKHRRCPLCDKDWESTICPVHGVPTIGPSHGPKQRLEAGMVLIERFRISGLLTQGGMGALLSATDLRSGRPAVVKVLRGERIDEPTNVRRFYQEARAVRALSHPNIVEILMFGVDEGTGAPFLAMEHIPGRTLKVCLAEDGPMAEARAVVIFLQIARALEAAHRANVLHRDLKPSNVMVHDDPLGPFVKVFDFGLAKPLEDPGAPPLTRPGKTVGTPAFMAPEQVAQRPQDARTDLYGLGCMLHAALTGSPPFTGRDLVEVMHKQMRNPAPPLPARLVDGEAPSAELRSLHHRLLAKSPDDRPRDMAAVVRALTALVPAGPPRPTADVALAAFADTRRDLDPVDAGSTVVDQPAARATGIGPSQTIATPRPSSSAPIDEAVTPPAMEAFGPGADDDAVTALVPVTKAPGPAGVPAAITEPDEPLPVRPGMVKGAPRDPHPGAATGSMASRAPRGDAAIVPPVPPNGHQTPPPTRRSAPVDRSLKWGLGFGGVALALALVVGTTFVPRRVEVFSRHGAGQRSDSASAHPSPSPTTRKIEVLTYPVRADVTIEGRAVGLAPVAIDRPRPGRPVKVLIWRAGYQTAQLTLQHDTPSPVEIRLAR